MEKVVKVGVGVYLLNSKKQVLLGLRKSAHAQGTWCPPGGHMEYGETNEQAAVREVKEETGLILEPEDLVFAGVTNDFFEDSGKHYITLHMICRKFQGTPKVTEPDKCVEWKWFDIDKLPSPLMLPNQNFFKQYQKNIASE